MRIFFLLLLLANLAFFHWHEPITAWLSERAAPAQPAAAARDGDVPPLVLLSERDAVHAEAEEPGVGSHDVTDAPVGRADEGSPTAPDLTPPLLAQEQGGKSEDQGSQPSSPVPAAPPAPVGASPAGASESPRPLLAVCLEAGPWTDATRARQATDAAKAAGIEAVLASTGSEAPASYLVVAKQRFDTRTGTRDLLRRMTESGIKDIAVVSVDDKWTVSLGLFSQSATAERRRRDIAALGYEPEVRRRGGKPAVQTLRLNPAGAQAGALDGLLKQWKQADPAIEWHEAACP